MSTAGNHFRTVAFGGFHKQDVLDYITASSRENQEQSAQLKMQAETAQKENAELEEKFEAAEAARKRNAAECERLSETLTQRTAALEKAERELAELKAAHEKASARLTELEERLPRLEADSTAYSALKERTATIEMEAHRRAQEITEQAQAQAARTRGELTRWLRRVQSSYQLLRGDVSATVSHLTGELERGRETLEKAASAFCQHDQTLTALLESEKAASGPKAPEPLPLKEVEEDGTEHG